MCTLFTRLRSVQFPASNFDIKRIQSLYILGLMFNYSYFMFDLVFLTFKTCFVLNVMIM